MAIRLWIIDAHGHRTIWWSAQSNRLHSFTSCTTETNVHFKGTPFLLFYVQWPLLLRRRIHIHYIHSKHHKQLGTPVPPPQVDCGYQPCSRYSPPALCSDTLCREVQRWLATQSGAFIKSHSIMLTWNTLVGMTNIASSTYQLQTRYRNPYILYTELQQEQRATYSWNSFWNAYDWEESLCIFVTVFKSLQLRK